LHSCNDCYCLVMEFMFEEYEEYVVLSRTPLHYLTTEVCTKMLPTASQHLYVSKLLEYMM